MVFKDGRKVASFNTQPPKGGWIDARRGTHGEQVSTHSRLKAAGSIWLYIKAARRCFNTQPPKGGWFLASFKGDTGERGFNTQPPKGGWGIMIRLWRGYMGFQHTAA